MDLPTRKVRDLLAYLWLHRHHPQRRDQLIALFWPESPEKKAQQSLRQALHRLNRILLLDPKAEEAPLVLTRTTAKLNPKTPYWVDVQEFEEKIQHAQRRQCEERAFFLRDAVQLYRGDLLEDCDEDWCQRERNRLRELFFTALRELIAYHSAQREYSPALRYAQQWLQKSPLQEEAHRQLMYLHYIRGDRNVALKQYHDYERLAQTELNAEPLWSTKALLKGMKDGANPACLAVLAGLEPNASLNNLPTPLTSFIGREKEIGELRQLLPGTRLLTLTGFGGCGKTRLALQVAMTQAHEFAGGVSWVELAALADPALVPQAIASALGVREQPGRPLVESLSEYFQSKRLLLVLDNCEHMLEACAELAGKLLYKCPSAQILATSREALGIVGETVWRVPPLSLPKETEPIGQWMEHDAIRLFVERARKERGESTATDKKLLWIAKICHRLDGIPLAIELAAARVHALTVEQIAQRLDDRFRLLTGGSRTAVPRQQTLQAAVDWSFYLLTEVERALLRRLSVFAGSFTLEAVEAICAGDGVEGTEVWNLLSRLVDKSLVIFNERGGEARYRLLETVRQYGQIRLLASGEAEVMRKRHCGFFAELAEVAEPELHGAQQAPWLDRLEAEHDNLRAACDWSLESTEKESLRLVAALWRLWHIRGYWSEGRQRLNEALNRSGSGKMHTALRAKALNGAGFLALLQGDIAAARALCQKSLDLHQELGNKQGVAGSLTNLAYVAYEQGRYEESRTLFEESLTLQRNIGDQRGIAISLHNLGNVAQFQGDYQTARSLYQESLAIRRQVNDKEGTADLLNSLGRAVHEQGDYEVSRTLFAESLALHRELGNKRGIALSLHNLGTVAGLQGDYKTAWVRFQEGLALRRQLWDKLSIAESFEGLAWVECATGHYEAAVHLYGAAEALREATHTPLPPADRAECARMAEAAQRKLGIEKLAQAREKGRTMTLDQALAYALDRKCDSCSAKETLLP